MSQSRRRQRLQLDNRMLEWNLLSTYSCFLWSVYKGHLNLNPLIASRHIKTAEQRTIV